MTRARRTTTGTPPAAARPSADTASRWTRRHLLTIDGLSRGEIEHILDTAEGFREVATRSVKSLPALRGRVVVNLFFEESTRTRISFTLAAQRLGADVIDFAASRSSVVKGESLTDTARTLEAMGVDIFVCRHPAPGAAAMVANAVRCGVINAGDGPHAHPTQALLDLFTIRQVFGRIEDLNVALVGDIAHSRVARSAIRALTLMGARVWLVGPPTLVPAHLAGDGVRISHDFDAVLPEMHVINMLRIQFERISGQAFPSLEEYVRLFGLTPERMRRARPEAVVMHPGPVNRGIEIASEVADGPRSLILTQVANGLAVRMAILFLINQALAENP